MNINIDEAMEKYEKMTDEELFDEFIKYKKAEGFDIKKTANTFKLYNIFNVASVEELFIAKKMIDIFLEMETDICTGLKV